MRITRFPCLFLLVSSGLPAQQDPPLDQLLAALEHTASTFSRTIPALTARESLIQTSRRGEMEVRRNGRNNEIRAADFTVSTDLQRHEVVSYYSFGTTAASPAFHEIRRILTIDGAAPPPAGTVRHAMTLDLQSDDPTAKEALEDLEQNQLQGAASDFGPLLLLFSGNKLGQYRFTPVGQRTLSTEDGDERAFVLSYLQLAGPESFTEFRDRREVRHAAAGEIWFRESDLLPLRVTLTAEEAITSKLRLRDEARVDYRPTQFGLAPAVVSHKQFVNRDLLVENQFTYSNYNGRTWLP